MILYMINRTTDIYLMLVLFISIIMFIGVHEPKFGFMNGSPFIDF